MKLPKFKKIDLAFHLKDSFKGLSKKYMMDCIFDDSIQEKWVPQMGDIMVGPTGNIFVISSVYPYHESIGGTCYFYGGGSCRLDGSGVMSDTYCYTANESGKWYHPLKGEQSNPHHSSIRKFRWVPWPHELEKLKK